MNIRTRDLVLKRGIEKTRMIGDMLARATDQVASGRADNAAEDQIRRAEAQSRAEETLLIDQGRL